MLYHALNGLRVIAIDFWDARAALPEADAVGHPSPSGLVLMVPGAYFMLMHTFESLVRERIMTVTPDLGLDAPRTRQRNQLAAVATSRCTRGCSCGSPGLVLVFLVLGHLFIMNILDGGVQRINFAFVAGRWCSPFWQVWDLRMLWLAMLHGANGLRVIINDYAEQRQDPVLAEVGCCTLATVVHRRPGNAGDLHLRPEPRLSEEPPWQMHKYDVVIVGAGGAGMRAALESGQRARTAVLTKLYPTRSHTGAAQGGMCAALANVEEDNWEWHTFDTIKGGDYLVDQDAAEIMAKEAIDAVLDLEKMGLPFNRTPEGRIDQRRFGGHTRNHGEAAVRRACYAADRTGHMILQTLYQNCIKHGIEFYNEFYVLDVLLNDGQGAGVVAYELATGETARLPGQVRGVRHRRLRQGLQDHLQRPHPHR